MQPTDQNQQPTKSLTTSEIADNAGGIVTSLSLILDSGLDKICDRLAASFLYVIREFLYIKLLIDHLRGRPKSANTPPPSRLWFSIILAPIYVLLGVFFIIQLTATIPVVLKVVFLLINALAAVIGFAFGVHALWKSFINLRQAYRDKQPGRYAHTAVFIMSAIGILAVLMAVAAGVLAFFAIASFPLTIATAIIGITLSAIALIYSVYNLISKKAVAAPTNASVTIAQNTNSNTATNSNQLQQEQKKIASQQPESQDKITIITESPATTTTIQPPSTGDNNTNQLITNKEPIRSQQNNLNDDPTKTIDERLTTPTIDSKIETTMTTKKSQETNQIPYQSESTTEMTEQMNKQHVEPIDTSIDPHKSKQFEPPTTTTIELKVTINQPSPTDNGQPQINTQPTDPPKEENLS